MASISMDELKMFCDPNVMERFIGSSMIDVDGYAKDELLGDDYLRKASVFFDDSKKIEKEMMTYSMVYFLEVFPLSFPDQYLPRWISVFVGDKKSVNKVDALKYCKNYFNSERISIDSKKWRKLSERDYDKIFDMNKSANPWFLHKEVASFKKYLKDMHDFTASTIENLFFDVGVDLLGIAELKKYEAGRKAEPARQPRSRKPEAVPVPGAASFPLEYFEAYGDKQIPIKGGGHKPFLQALQEVRSEYCANPASIASYKQEMEAIKKDDFFRDFVAIAGWRTGDSVVDRLIEESLDQDRYNAAFARYKDKYLAHKQRGTRGPAQVETGRIANNMERYIQLHFMAKEAEDRNDQIRQVVYPNMPKDFSLEPEYIEGKLFVEGLSRPDVLVSKPSGKGVQRLDKYLVPEIRARS